MKLSSREENIPCTVKNKSWGSRYLAFKTNKQTNSVGHTETCSQKRGMLAITLGAQTPRRTACYQKKERKMGGCKGRVGKGFPRGVFHLTIPE